MRQLLGALLLGATVLSGTALAGGNFTLDGKNTNITFVGTKPQGKHDGGFKEVHGVATAEGTDASTLKLNLDIDTTSLYTDTPKLTAHLKSPDFFSVKSYPKAKFVSSKVEKSGTGYTITGDLTLLGKTKTITIPADIRVAKGGLNITSQFAINRQDYGMSFGTGKVNDEVKIKVAVKAK
jgi:polyisoprenoid-binding protein YceI